MRILLYFGANPNVVDNIGLSSLHLASLYGKSNVVEAHIARGANISQKTIDGATPLKLAVQCGSAETVDILLLADAFSFEKNGPEKSETLLKYAVKLLRTTNIS